jgi:hypothetical protein
MWSDAGSVAVLITCASTGFTDQADRFHAIEIASLLVHSGVPADHIRLDIPRVKDVTVDNPRAHPDCPPLHLPPVLEQVVKTNGKSVWAHVFSFFEAFDRDPSVSRMIWIYFNHGTEAGLWFPDLGGVFVGDTDMVDLFEMVRKPTLVVWDACCSGQLAQAVMEKFTRETSVGILTSGFDNCRSSAVVLSGRDNDCLPKRAYTAPDGTAAHVRYRVGHSMFGRGFLLEVAYSQRNLRFRELTACLNDGKHRGFHAQFWTNSTDMKNASLRNFFPPFVSDSTPVAHYCCSGEEPITFAQLILPNRLGTLYDDRGDDTGLPVASNQVSQGAFVLIHTHCPPQVLADRSPKSHAIIEKGFLGKVNADLTNPIVLRAHQLHWNTERAAPIPATKEEPVYVPLELIACWVIEELRKRIPGLECNEEVLHDPNQWQRVTGPIRRVNGQRLVDTFGRSLLAAWTVDMDFETEVMPIFLEMRDKVASFLQTPLGKEDYETF